MAENEKVVQVETTKLISSASNRSIEEDGDLEQLAKSVELEGVLVPLIVRRSDKTAGKEALEIVAGHRRFLAAKKAGLPSVPCLIRELSDSGAARVQILENLHRKNLNPMEEARAFNELTRGDASISPGMIAGSVGKDVKYVYRAMKLLDLPAKAQKAIERGQLSAAHGHQLCRVGPKQIETAVEFALSAGYRSEFPTLQELTHFISLRVEKKLASAPFEKSEPYAGKIACKGCPSNTANQDLLFDQAEDGFCTNGVCFLTKMRQFYKDLKAVGEKRWKHLPFIGEGTSGYGEIQTIQGYQVVEANDPKVKKAFAEYEKGESGAKAAPYGFGILKPSNWGTLKTPKLVILQKLKEGEKQDRGGYREPTPEERYHSRFVCAYMEQTLRPDYDQLEKRRRAAELLAEKEWKLHKKEIIAEYEKKEATPK